MRFAWAFGAVLCGSICAHAQYPSPYRLRADVKFLASDLLEGRAPGTRGDLLAAEYVRTRFAELGLETSTQAVNYLAQETLATTRLGQFAWLTDVAVVAPGQQDENTFQFADVVFAGYGITAPEYQWDDYGDTTVRGKIVVLLAGEPMTDDAAFFQGATDTEYATPEHKFFEATKRGALGALIIHDVAASGFTWDSVRRRWGAERFVLPRGPRIASEPAPMQFEGWLAQQAAAKWLETTYEKLSEEARTPGFKARRVEKRLAGRVFSRTRAVATRNVIAVMPGAENSPVRQSLLFTAHLDSLGSTSAKPDAIHNGAVDNATGVAALLELARLWHETDPRPMRGAIFVVTGAEEAGAFGANAYATTPVFPLDLTPLHIGLHGYLPFGRTRDFHLAGAERSIYWPQIRQTVERFGLVAKITNQLRGPLLNPDPFGKTGMASFTLQPGSDYSSEPERKAKLIDDHLATRHHLPADEYSDDWDMSGLEQVVRLAFEIGVTVANAPAPAK